MTTHEMARELLELPNVHLVIEGWCNMHQHAMSADLTDYSDAEAIIWQKPDPDYNSSMTADSVADWKWININEKTNSK